MRFAVQTEESIARVHNERANGARNNRIAESHAKTCANCGSPFTAVNVRKLVCPDCDLDEARRVTDHRVTFIAVDGEGIGKWRDHKYVLLGVGDKQIENPDGLTFDQIMTFLWSQYLEHPDAVFAGFFLGYDFNQWFKRLPENRARMLLTDPGKKARARKNSGNNRTPFPVGHGDWEFDILGMKRFRLRKKGEKHWMYVCDAGSFFQTSLMTAIDPKWWQDPIVTDEEFATLEEGKAKRDSAELDSDMRRYNILENDVLARLMQRLNEGFSDAGIRLKKDQWFGPGQAAQAWMILQKQLTKRKDSLVSQKIREIAESTYYGGWFELMAHGHVPGTSWEYDINSAYPHIIRKLPCLEHGRWTEGTEAPFSVAQGTLAHGVCNCLGLGRQRVYRADASPQQEWRYQPSIQD